MNVAVRARKFAGIFLGALAIAMPSMAEASSAPPESSADDAHVFTSGEVVVPPGTTDQVEVVMTGPSDGTSVPMIVRNNTADAVERVEVTGIARDSAGSLVATGSSHGFNPYALQPGEWAIGYVYFDIDVLTGDEQFEFSVIAAALSDLPGKVPLTVIEATLRPGDFGDRIVGIAQNNTSVDAVGPNEVYAACFDGAALTGVVTAFTETDTVPAGGIAPFTIDFYDEVACPSMAIASSGWDF